MSLHLPHPLLVFGLRVSGMPMDTTTHLGGNSAKGRAQGLGDLPMVEGTKKNWPSKSVSMHESLQGKGSKPTPVIRLGNGNGHGHKRQRHFRAKKVVRPIAAEERAFETARAAWGRHHHYLLHERAAAQMLQQASPRSASIQTALRAQWRMA